MARRYGGSSVRILYDLKYRVKDGGKIFFLLHFGKESGKKKKRKGKIVAKAYAIPSYLWQYKLGRVSTRFYAISSQSSNFFSKFRTVSWLTDVYQQIAVLRHLAVDLLNLLRNKTRY